MTGAVEASLRQVADDLTQVGVRWALVGGFAVSSRAEPRFTRVVDVCVLVDNDADAEGLVHVLGRHGYAVDSVVEHEQRQLLATIRLVSPVPGGVLVDLLFASSGVEAEIVAAAESLEILPGLVVPVAPAAHLAVLKLLARDDATRPQDAIDLRALRPTLTRRDHDEVHRLVGLVTARGFNRDRDLVALAQEYLEQP